MAAKRRKKRFLANMKKRLLIAVLLFMAAFVVIVGWIIYLNVKHGAEYREAVMVNQNYTSEPIKYKRGDILDTNGAVLATSQKVYDLVLEPFNIVEYEMQKEITINALIKYFGLTETEIAGYLADPDSKYKPTDKKGIPYDQVKPYLDYIETDEGYYVRGVVLEERYTRVYPNGELACHMLGFMTGDDGAYGLEYNYDDTLSGTNGRIYSYYNEELGKSQEIELPTNGNNIVTSIDSNVQRIVQQNVEKYMNTEGAKNVSVIVMDPKTCHLLALYNSHNFDPNNAYDLEACKYQFETDEEFRAFLATDSDAAHVEGLENVWHNFTVSDAFEPGSTYKTFTIAGAMEDNVITPETPLYCDGGEQKDTFYIKCWYADYGTHGAETPADALANSCNDALMQIAVKEGPAIFDKYQKMFGFGAKTNIDIPGEQSSFYIYHEDELNVTELATSSFGQGVTCTMIQLCTAFSSVINGGYYYQPSVVKRIEDENGNVVDAMDPVLVRKTISQDVSDEMRKELQGVVENGTGQKAAVEGYKIGGKTGTAEKLPRGNGKYLISFIGFAPVEDPQVVVYVVVDEPKVEDQGNSSAASYLFADIAKDLFPYLNIYREGDDYKVDVAHAQDEVAHPIYEGEIPKNDVAGGEENPYVQEEMEDAPEQAETPEMIDTDGDGIPDTPAPQEIPDDSYSEDGYSEDEYYEEENWEDTGGEESYDY